jgi:hypothetical protein
MIAFTGTTGTTSGTINITGFADPRPKAIPADPIEQARQTAKQRSRNAHASLCRYKLQPKPCEAVRAIHSQARIHKTQLWDDGSSTPGGARLLTANDPDR